MYIYLFLRTLEYYAYVAMKSAKLPFLVRMPMRILRLRLRL